MTAPTRPSYADHWFPAKIISHTVWLYFPLPLRLRNVDEILAARLARLENP
jgi:putative transposase